MIWYLLYQLWYQLQVVYNMLQSLFKKKWYQNYVSVASLNNIAI